VSTIRGVSIKVLCMQSITNPNRLSKCLLFFHEQNTSFPHHSGHRFIKWSLPFKICDFLDIVSTFQTIPCHLQMHKQSFRFLCEILPVGTSKLFSLAAGLIWLSLLTLHRNISGNNSEQKEYQCLWNEDCIPVALIYQQKNLVPQQ